MSHDVIVVGAGPAGAASAMLLAEHGMRVLALDRARFPRPKICGEYLSPEAARVLDRLGVLKTLDAAGATPLAGMRITAPDGTVVTGSYRPFGAWRPYRDHALAVPRATLDATLADRLRQLPIDFREETRVTDLVVENDQVVGVHAAGGDGVVATFRAPLVIGCDGRHSVVAQRLGVRRGHRLRRMALVTYVTDLPDCDAFGEIFVDPPDYAILNPVAPGLVNMSLVVPLAHAASWSSRLETFFTARVKHFQRLARRVGGARRVAPVQALGPLAYEVRAPRQGGALLVGDAAGFYDPLTGEGIFSALRGAELAADVAVAALRAGDTSRHRLAGYAEQRRAVFADKERFTRALGFVTRHRRLANLVGHHLARHPTLVDLLLGVVGDFVPPRAVLPALLGRS